MEVTKSNMGLPALQELQQPRLSDQQKFDLAVQERKIVNSNLEELKQVLRLVMMKVGLRSQNWPEGEEKEILLSHIVENFGYHSCTEIKLAFEMAMSGKLSLKPDEVKCYENFSCLYFSSIMNAYRVWAGEAYKQAERKEPLPEQKILSEEDYLNTYRESIELNYQRFLSELELEELLLPEFIYSTLVKDGFIPENYHEQKVKEAKEMMAREKHLKIIEDPDMERHISNQLRKMRMGKDYTVQFVSKQLAVKMFFIDCLQKNVKALYQKVS